MNPSQPPLPPPPGGPRTREIPLTAPGGAAPRTGATAPDVAATGGATPGGAHTATGTASAAPLATGPVDYVPGPPSVGPATAPGPGAAGPDTTRKFVVDLSDEPRTPRPHPRLRAAALVLGVVAAAALELGLLMHGGAATLWSQTPLWSAFASLAVVAGLAGVAGRLAGSRPAARPIALAGLGGLAVFWLLVALPAAGTDRGFVLTAALGCLIGAVWATGRAEDGASPAEATV